VLKGEAQDTFTQAMCGSSWLIRVRGDIDELAPQLYRCRAGHEFVLDAPLSLVPDEIPCATSGGPRDCRSSAAWQRAS
jgi:hypothetical protein